MILAMTLVGIGLFVIFLVIMFYFLSERENGTAAVMAFLALLSFGMFYYGQTHRVVPVQHVGVARNGITQELSEVQAAGLVSKPFFGSVYTFPSSTSTEYCTVYNPSLKGSYGINTDICLYYDTSSVDWKKEIERTGSLDAGTIMGVWRNSIVSDVAESIKRYTPEALSEDRQLVETAIFNNVFPWFNERGISLVRVSFVNWDFSSEQVAATFDESIVSQRKIAEQSALLEAAKLSREREEYEAETAALVAAKQEETLNGLGLEGDLAVEYLWIRLYQDAGQVPQFVVRGTNVPIAVNP